MNHDSPLAIKSMTDLPRALFKSRPEDFVVDEIPAYDPSGEGEHLFVRFRKTGLNTAEAVRRLAAALGASERQIGSAGVKDRWAVTSQTVSLPWPLARDPQAELSGLSLEGIELLSWQRHIHKLKPGHLRGNRFEITLRELGAEAIGRIEAELEVIGRHGVPNAFGAQRFGFAGDNAQRAAAWIIGDARPPRDRRKARFMFSAWQSSLFNQVLELREQNGSWRRALPGDLAQKHDSGGMFLVEPADDAPARAERGELSATGPMFGAKMRWPAGEVETLERGVLADAFPDQPDPLGRLRALKKLGEGTRRPLRLWVADLGWRADAAAGYLTVSFVLPKGGYATTVLSRACHLEEPERDRPAENSRERD
jgi:tRNA pseudouridine13 synthase